MKLAFIGTGKIIEDALFAVSVCKDIESSAIFAREHSKDKAERLAAKFNLKEVFTSYDELLLKTSADTVYIGLVNSAHFSYAKKALQYGKNVILEKPFTGFLKETLELIELAKAKGLFLFEAISVLHAKAMDRIKSSLEKIGRIRLFNANYSQYSSRYDSYRKGVIEHAFDPAYYGGALFDLNIYNVHYCVELFGKPKSVEYFANRGSNGIDTSGVLVLSYDDFQAVCTAAKDSDSRCYLSIQGEDGSILVDSKPNVADKVQLKYVRKAEGEQGRDSAGAVIRTFAEEIYESPEVHHRMTQEFSDFAEIIRNKDYSKADDLIKSTREVMEILETARVKAGIEFV